MTVALRAHHLLCMLTYVGKGYSAEFAHNFDGLASRLAAGEEVLLVEGPDAICAPLCESEGACAHCHGTGVRVNCQNLQVRFKALDKALVLFNLLREIFE